MHWQFTCTYATSATCKEPVPHMRMQVRHRSSPACRQCDKIRTLASQCEPHCTHILLFGLNMQNSERMAILNDIEFVFHPWLTTSKPII